MAGSTEHRRAPRRSVVEVRKVGSWGNIVYHHILACGHIEKRPRNESQKKLACIWCLRAEQKTLEMASLATVPARSFVSDEDFATREAFIMDAQATIASKLGVATDAVDVVTQDVNGVLEIKYATVFLTANDVHRIAGRTGREVK